MGKQRGAYNEEFPVGSEVVIRSRSFLESFLHDWKLHHPLQEKQVAFAGRVAKVRSVSFYHGHDELYELEGVPGTWHEQCLEAHAVEQA